MLFLSIKGKINFLAVEARLNAGKLLGDGLYQVKIDFESMFDEICLDPRLENDDFEKMKNQLENKTSIPIIQSDLYKFDLEPIRFDIEVSEGYDE
jgi:hypothetical protein